jgi:hypothetical protein
LAAWPGYAQVRLGELSAGMTGTVAPGYSATYGNQSGSSHAWELGGSANFSGSYHSPNFLSFNAGLYLNQSRANSDFQSISNASGVNATTTIFGGSEFPGAISYSKAYNSDGNYAIPGIANYVTHGNSDDLAVNWSENVPQKPSFSAGYDMGSSQYTVYGANDQGRNTFRSLNLHSSYQLEGFNLGGFYAQGTSHSLIPQIITGQANSETTSDNGAYGFNVSHTLPLRGSMSGAFNRSSWDSNFLGDHSTGSVDLLSAVAAVHPWTRFSLSASANYSDNLSGQLEESVPGNVIPGLNASQTSDSLDLEAVASYAPEENLQTSVSVERRTQTFLGETYGVTSYGANASYARPLLDGNFSAAGGVTANSADNSGTDTIGFSSTATYNRTLYGWHLNGSFGYAQNAQTLLVTYMNSYYNYSGSARRAWGKVNFSAGAAAGRTALTQQAGTADSSESYNASLGYGAWAVVTGSYSKASGQAIATGAGLVPVPPPTPVVPSSLVSLYGGNSYSFSLSSTPVKRLILEAGFARSTSNTDTIGITSANENEEFNALVQYQYRKLNFTSGFARLQQGFSGSGVPPAMVSSYYFGASRWFKFF